MYRIENERYKHIVIPQRAKKSRTPRLVDARNIGKDRSRGPFLKSEIIFHQMKIFKHFSRDHVRKVAWKRVARRILSSKRLREFIARERRE